MQLFFRLFFKSVRAVLGPLILAWDRIFSPKPMIRTSVQQQGADHKASKLILYHFEACPFCVRVRREIKRLGIPIEMREVKRNRSFHDELMAGGKNFQVPCLRIQDPTQARWMYESAEINRYLQAEFGHRQLG